MKRCDWAKSGNAAMKDYHDTVWGVPEYRDDYLFRKLILDINQAGLSWQTILNKSEAFDEAYDNFVIEKVAAFDDKKVAELMNNAGIIRNRRKIEAAIQNAKCVLAIQQEWGSFANYLWHFVAGKPVVSGFKTAIEVPATTALSDEITKDLKKRGFKFVGSTIIYAFLQAIGIVNDHLTTCFRYEEIIEKTMDKKS
ncbi:DNA-3-methyladenine glycosylase I [Enterococcus canintestini]|uniref:DNA-3-methyladenine glycosylase I n=1 Tax=Enterococcus canintestini TaxID=317010 RepID=A0A1L8R5R4_9ENTE|nr:DNA-3-methyladenine glycosylase I [Enterococcus canintestini]OJG15098.1 DNA-3-methyladenine glycosylase I [Enterococcus canintestini]